MNQPKPLTLLKPCALTMIALAMATSAVPIQAQNFAPVTGLSGGVVSLVAADRNATNPSVAVGINDLGLFTGAASVAKDGTTVGSLPAPPAPKIFTRFM